MWKGKCETRTRELNHIFNVKMLIVKKNNEVMVVEMSLRFLYFKYIILINYYVEV